MLQLDVGRAGKLHLQERQSADMMTDLQNRSYLVR